MYDKSRLAWEAYRVIHHLDVDNKQEDTLLAHLIGQSKVHWDVRLFQIGSAEGDRCVEASMRDQHPPTHQE